MRPYVIPVLLGSGWKFFPPLDQKDTGITDVSRTDLTQTAGTERVTTAKHSANDRQAQESVRDINIILSSLSYKSGPEESAADSPEAALEVCLIAFAVSEAGAGGLGPADAAALNTPVHLRLMEAKHLQQHGQKNKTAVRQ